MRLISFTVPGVPKAKGRHRTTAMNQCNSCGKQVFGRNSCPCGSHSLQFVRNIEFKDAATASFENLVALVAQQQMNGQEKFLGPTLFKAAFYFPIPASRVKKLKENDSHCQRPDLDNLQKSVIDGMLRVCLNDDCNICEITAAKYWSNNPRSEVTLVEL